MSSIDPSFPHPQTQANLPFVASRICLRLFTQKPTRGLGVLAFATAAYLIGEVSFSSWLIDVMGSAASSTAIIQAEQVGRILSGIAVALLFWPVFLDYHRTKWGAAASIVVFTTLSVVGIYHLEGALISHLKGAATAQDQQAALTGSMLRQALLTGQVTDSMFGGFWSADIAKSQDGRAFAGLVPFLAADSRTALADTLAIAPKILRGVIDTRDGGAAGAYQRFVASQQAIRDSYGTYQAGVNEYRAAISPARVDEFAEHAWTNYIAAISNHGRRELPVHPKNKEYVSWWSRGTVRDQVRRSGIPVPANWQTADKATFVAAARIAAHTEALKTFQSHAQGLPPGLSITEFATQPAVQAEWRRALGLQTDFAPGSRRRDEVSPVLPINGLSEAEFAQRSYPWMLAARAKQELNAMATPARFVAPQGGRQAYEAVISAALGLTLSLLGALTHILKTGLLGIQLTTGWHFRSGWTKASLIVMILLAAAWVSPWTIATPLTSHPTYQRWLHAAPLSPDGDQSNHDDPSSPAAIATGNFPRPTLSSAVRRGLDATLRIQSLCYPAFSSIQNAFSPLWRLMDAVGIEPLIVNHIDF